MAKANSTLSPIEPKNQDAGLTTLCDPEHSTLWGLVLNLYDIHATLKLLEHYVSGRINCERCDLTEGVAHMLVNSIWQCQIAASSFAEKYEERFPDKIDDGQFLSDVSTKIQEAAVVLQYAHAEYEKEGSKDADRLSSIIALGAMSRYLDNFGTEFEIYDGGEMGDGVARIFATLTQNITTQANDLMQHVNSLDTRTSKDILGWAAYHLLSEAGNELTGFIERHKDNVETGSDESVNSEENQDG